MITPETFVETFGNSKIEKDIRFAKVDPGYSSGRPLLIFDGESVISGKSYPYLSSYTPAANDRVMILKGVIVGKII
jgi:hypothetical protein